MRCIVAWERYHRFESRPQYLNTAQQKIFIQHHYNSLNAITALSQHHHRIICTFPHGTLTAPNHQDRVWHLRLGRGFKVEEGIMASWSRPRTWWAIYKLTWWDSFWCYVGALGMDGLGWMAGRAGMRRLWIEIGFEVSVSILFDCWFE